MEVDSFRQEHADPYLAVQPPIFTQADREAAAAIIRRRPYYDPTNAYLVLHPLSSFTQNNGLTGPGLD